MKKLMSVLLALMLLLGSFALAEAPEFVGVWYLTTISTQGMELSVTDLGLEMVLTLNEDKTATMEITGEDTETATWEEKDGTISLIDGESVMAFTYADGVLTGKDGEDVMIFSKEKPVAAVFDPGAALTDAALEAFNGEWTATTLAMGDMTISAAMMGMDMTMTIDNGAVKIISLAMGATEDKTVAAEFVDGALVISEEHSRNVIQLFDSGMLAMTEYAGDTVIGVVYFETVAK